jgi:hypothetical protein
MRLIGMIIATLAASTGVADAQISCQKVGSQTYCSNGQAFQRFGTTNYDGQGHAWQQSGDRTSGADGTTYRRSGSQIYDSKGNSLQRFGDQTYRSDGTVYRKSSDGTNVSQQFRDQKRGTKDAFCHPIGNEYFCDPAPDKSQQQRGLQADSATGVTRDNK